MLNNLLPIGIGIIALGATGWCWYYVRYRMDEHGNPKHRH